MERLSGSSTGVDVHRTYWRPSFGTGSKNRSPGHRATRCECVRPFLPCTIDRDIQHGRDLLMVQAREVPQFNGLGSHRVFVGQLHQGLIQRDDVVVLRPDGGVGQWLTLQAAAAFDVLFAADSTRIRRMASAAAAKKCPRLSHGWALSDRQVACKLRGPKPWPAMSGQVSGCQFGRRQSP